MDEQQRIDSVRNLTGVFEIAKSILSHLSDAESLRNASKVSPYWRNIIREGRLWARLIERNVANDKVWAKLVQKRRNPIATGELNGEIWDEILHDRVEADIRELDSRWRQGYFTIKHYFANGPCSSYCRDDEIAVGSLFDGARIWNLESGLCVQTCAGFDWLASCQSRRDSEQCIIRFDDRVVALASVDGHIQFWDRRDPAGSGASSSSSLEWAGSTISRLEMSNNLLVAADLFSASLAVFGIQSPRDVRFVRSISMFGEPYHHLEFANMHIAFAKVNTNIRFLTQRAHQLVKAMEVCELKCRDGRMVTISRLKEASSTRWKLTLWDVERGARLRSIELDSRGLPRFCFDGKRLVVACRELRPARAQFQADGLTGSSYAVGVIDMKHLLDENLPAKDLFSVVLREQFEDSIESLSIDEFRVKFCLWPDGNLIIWNFQGSDPPLDE